MGGQEKIQKDEEEEIKEKACQSETTREARPKENSESERVEGYCESGEKDEKSQGQSEERSEETREGGQEDAEESGEQGKEKEEEEEVFKEEGHGEGRVCHAHVFAQNQNLCEV